MGNFTTDLIVRGRFPQRFNTMPIPAVYAADAHGFPTQYASKIENIYSSEQGDAVTVTAAAGDCLVAVAIGLRQNTPFDLLHGNNPSYGSGNALGYLQGLNDWFPASPTISDASGDSVAVTSVTETVTTYTLSSVAASVGTTAVYTGTGLPSVGAAVGYYFQIAGFTNASNNGYFLCTANTTTTLTLANASAVLETHAATATDYVVSLVTASNNFVVGDSVALAGIVTETWLNGQTTAVVTSGSTFTINDPTKNASSSGPTAQTGATASRTSGNDWALYAHLNLADSDYTPSATPPTAPNPYPASQWSIDGYYPSVYVWYALNVTAGTYKVSLNSMYSTGGLTSGEWQYGRPIFEGGVNFQVYRFSGIATSAAADGTSIGTSTAAAAAPAAFTTTQGSELLFAVGLMKSGNVFGVGNVNQGGTNTADVVTQIGTGKLVGSEAHYMVSFATPASASATTYLSFSNPLGYEMIVANIALKHS